MVITAVLTAFLILSLAGNGALLFLLRRMPAKKPDYDARMLLRDLLSGRAVVKITPIDQNEILIRSPRDVR